MTEEQRQQLELIKAQKGLTDKQAQEYLQGQNMSQEELADLQQKTRQAVENPYGTWGTINTSQIFGKQ
jgi:hypothetical protein